MGKVVFGRGAVVLALAGLVLGGVQVGAQAQPARSTQPTATCAEMNEQLWAFEAKQVVAECHARRAARAAERSDMILGNSSGGVSAKEWQRKRPNHAQHFAERAARTNDPLQAADFAREVSAHAAVLSGAAQPVMAVYGLGLLVETKDTGRKGAELVARQAAREAWKAAGKAANQGDGRDMALNIAADQAEEQAWQAAREAGWLG
ncbi:hypothetical protein N566_11450 [Streptomycetaceae bacterium MP113-05]|nr:hypothetical protein N566_11450 [Streptomycetaceae bacterium MP113-05]